MNSHPTRHKFSKFHTVLWKSLQNRILVPPLPPRSSAPAAQNAGGLPAKHVPGCTEVECTASYLMKVFQ